VGLFSGPGPAGADRAGAAAAVPSRARHLLPADPDLEGDATHPANSFTTTQICSDRANSSAEWIAKAPSGASGPYPLPDFSKWTLTSSSVANHVTGVISSFPYTEITMVDSAGKVQAQPVSNGRTWPGR
jgi:hypothetical protein